MRKEIGNSGTPERPSASRRDFLQTLIVAASSAGLAAAGCQPTQTMTTTDVPVDPTPPTPAPYGDGKIFFPQSVASGDPKLDSVVLWTRARDIAGFDVALRLQVATDSEFKTVVVDAKDLVARAVFDGALRVKVTGLTPRTRYYYRFLYTKSGTTLTSQVGRTRTAAAATVNTDVKFAVASCQDFAGRYYNSWARLAQLDEDLDFVLFIGDYIYETGDAPAVVAADPARQVKIQDPANALNLGTNRLAANNQNQYRALYQQFRGDEMLQRVHELYPFVCIWDDHEYSNDCWGATATYFNGRSSEVNPERRLAAERAYFEYMPIDDGAVAGQASALETADKSLYPNTKLWRELRFGTRLHLLLTDTRSYRPDHLIPEDGFPGKVVIDRNALAAAGVYALFDSDSFSCVNIDQAVYASQKAALTTIVAALAAQAGLTQTLAQQRAAQWVTGDLSLLYVNNLLTAASQSALVISPVGKDRGVAFVHMGKQQLMDSFGSRFLVVKGTFDLYAAIQYALSAKASENIFGDAQEAWLRSTLSTSTATWKVTASSISLTSGVFDMTAVQGLPVTLQQKFYYGLDQWDGFSNKRRELLSYIQSSNIANTMFIAGDIHAGFLSKYGTGAVAGAVVTTPAISSSTLQATVREAVLSQGFMTGTPAYAKLVTNLPATLAEGEPNLIYSAAGSNGFTIIALGSSDAQISYHTLPESEVSQKQYSASAAALAAKFTVKTFKLAAGVLTAV